MTMCLECKYYFVTWDKSTPRGCRAYGFQGSEMPVETLIRVTGMNCQLWEKKVIPAVKDGMSPKKIGV